MAAYPISVSSNRQASIPIEIQQSLHPTQRLSVGGPPFSNFFDQPINHRILPQQRRESEKRIKFLPPFISLILGSTYFLIALCIILIIPILQLVIGIVYIDQCDINQHIPIYLIVTGACGIVGVGLTLIIVIFFLRCAKQDTIAGSCISACLIGFILAIIVLLSLFLFAWFIAGNVWIFGARNEVRYDTNDGRSKYCHPTLYQFAFWIIILTYIMIVISCCLSCCRACCQSVKTLKA